MKRHAISVFAILFCGIALFDCAIAEEQSQEFLQKLREQGYYDLVEAYLERAAADGDGALQESLAYERAVNVFQKAINETNRQQRDEQLETAGKLFAEFIAKRKDGPLVVEANSRLRKIAMEQARSYVARSKEENAKDVDKLLHEARVRFDIAFESFEQHAEAIKKELKSKDKSRSVGELRNEFLQAKLALANIKYEKATTLKSAEKKVYKQALKDAATEFKDLADKYPKYAAALLATVYEGRCYQDLGDYRKALGLYEEFLDPQGSPLAISSLAAKLAIQCHAEKDPAKALEVGEKWLDEAGNRNHPDVQDMQLSLATTLQEKAGDGKDGRKWLAAARKKVLPLARSSGPLQLAARKLLARLPGGEAIKTSAEDIGTYADAKLAAEEARGELQSVETMLRVLKPRLRTAKDAGTRRELQKDIDETAASISSLRQNAIRFYQLALEMAPGDADSSELNQIRYFLGLLFYQEKQYFDSAVLSEHLARKHVGDPVAKPSAKLALASYQLLYGDGKDPVLSNSAMNHLIDIADYTAATWPNEREAQDALMTLVSFMVFNGNVDRAQKYLNKIPADSPRRGEAEMKTGRALWSSYTTQMKLAEGKSNAKLDDLKKRAQQMLKSGVDRMKSSGKSADLALAALSLAQIYIDTNQPDAAVNLLNDKEIGPMTLVKQNDPTVQAPGMSSAVFKTALRAQLGRMATSKDNAAAIQETRSTMGLLKASMGDTPLGKQQLIGTYVGLARDLRNQLELTPVNAKAGLAKGFDVFLGEVNKASKEFNVKNWIAETYYKLGEALETNDATTPEARQYFAKSGDMYKDILAQADGGTVKLDPAMKIQMRMRRAGTMRRLGSYDKAIDEFEQILRARNGMMDIQIEAAGALKASAMAGDAKRFNEAINGSRRNPNTGKNTIWGWSRIARIAQQQMQKGGETRKQFEGKFFDAQFEYAECRYLQGIKSNGDEKTKWLKSARKVIGYTASSFPDLGGPAKRRQFDQLLKKVQQALGTAPEGLAPVK